MINIYHNFKSIATGYLNGKYYNCSKCQNCGYETDPYEHGDFISMGREEIKADKHFCGVGNFGSRSKRGGKRKG